MQSLFLIKLVILQGVYDVETDQPKYHSYRQQQWQHGAVLQRLPAVARWEQAEIPFHRQPRSQRRQRQRQAQEDMREIREPLRQRIEADKKERDRRKIKADRVDPIACRNQARRAQQAKRPRFPQRNPAGRQMPRRRPGFSRSNSRSAIRLNDMAQVRAQTIAARMSKKILQPGQPRLSRAATAIEAKAKGSAKMVWGNLMNSDHFRNCWNRERIQQLFKPVRAGRSIRTVLFIRH